MSSVADLKFIIKKYLLASFIMTNLPSQTDETAIFPKLTKTDLMEFQFSSWYPRFSGVSIRSSIIRPLADEFCQYLTSEGVFIPEGSEDLCVIKFIALILFTIAFSAQHTVRYQTTKKITEGRKMYQKLLLSLFPN